jgi:hypothetical protein
LSPYPCNWVDCSLGIEFCIVGGVRITRVMLTVTQK